MRAILVLIFIFTYSHLVNAEDIVVYESQDQVARNLLKEFKQSDKQILMLAESGHEELAAVQFFIEMYSDTFDFIALEVGSDRQAMIDDFMNGKTQTLNTLSGRLKDPDMRLVLLQLFKRIRRMNKIAKAVGLKPMDVLAIDKPMEGFENEGDWFQARDPHMFEILRSRIEAGQRGFIYMGGGHLTRKPLPTPQLLREKMNMPDLMLTLGSKIEEAFPNRSMRIWLNAPFPMDKAADRMPPDMLFLAQIDEQFRQLHHLSVETGVFALPTDNPTFKLAEQRAREPHSIPFSLVEDFDFYVSLLRAKRADSQSCESTLIQDDAAGP